MTFTIILIAIAFAASLAGLVTLGFIIHEVIEVHKIEKALYK